MTNRSLKLKSLTDCVSQALQTGSAVHVRIHLFVLVRTVLEKKMRHMVFNSNTLRVIGDLAFMTA